VARKRIAQSAPSFQHFVSHIDYVGYQIITSIREESDYKFLIKKLRYAHATRKRYCKCINDALMSILSHWFKIIRRLSAVITAFLCEDLVFERSITDRPETYMVTSFDEVPHPEEYRVA
jgi:hypothetical protein